MPTPVVIPANLQWVGAAKETTYGTAVAAPVFWIPVDGSSLKFKPNVNVLTDQSLRGLMSVDFQQVQGMRYDTLAYKTFLYLDSVYQHCWRCSGRPTPSPAPATRGPTRRPCTTAPAPTRRSRRRTRCSTTTG
jgi:hypothetical protein